VQTSKLENVQVNEFKNNVLVLTNIPKVHMLNLLFKLNLNTRVPMEEFKK